MRTMLAAGAFAITAMAAQSPSGFACDLASNAGMPRAGAQVSTQASAVQPAQYEWQYHYVGRHQRIEGYWAPVK